MYLRLYTCIYMYTLNEEHMNTSCLCVHTLTEQKVSLFLTLQRLY